MVKQFDQGDSLYLVETGELKCFKVYSGETDESFQRDYKPGDCFGE